MTRFACVFHVLRPSPRRKRICSLCIYIISVRTHAGCSIAPDLMQMGACNQGKKTFRAKSMQSGATPPPRLLLERIFRMHAYAFLKKQAKKKSPRNRLFSTFLCQTLKRIFCQLSVTSENYIPQ